MASSLSFDHVVCVSYVPVMAGCSHIEKSTGPINLSMDPGEHYLSQGFYSILSRVSF